ncbi:MAG: tetratricopeptide repeat protein [bacterium]
MRTRSMLLAALIGLAAPSMAHAQDDWGVSSDRQQEIVRRYKQLLERNPTEGLAFNKLLDYVGKGKGLDALIEEYSARAKKAPDDANMRLILGHLYKAKAEYELALAEYEVAVKLQPDKPLVWLSRGSVHLLLQHEAEATADFEKGLSLEKDKSQKQEILRRLADLAFNQRDWESAQKYYDQLVDLDPRNEYLRMEYAQVLVRYKRYDKAVEQYEALLKLAGRDAKAKANTLRDLGDLYEQMGKDEEALKTYNEAMALVKAGNWLEKELRQRIVAVYRRTDRLGELVASYEKKWRSPNYDQAMELGDLFDELGQEDKALKYYKIASQKSGRNVDPRMKIIRILERGGKDKEVIAAYKEIVRIAPQAYRYQFDLVRLHFRLGNRKEAESLLKQIASRFSRDADVWVMLADTYMRFEMRDDALKAYQKLVKMDPKNDAFILGLGEFYFQTGDLDKAVDVWVKLLDSSLEPAEAYAKLGQVLAEHGLIERGLKHYEKAVEIAPKDLNVRRGLALAYENARQWQKAIDTWTFVLDNADQPFTANEARSRVINIYRKQNRLRSKMRDFQQAFEARPPSIQAGFFLAEAYVKLAEFDEAERIYKQLAKLPSGDSNDVEIDALLSLEKLYTQTSNYTAGISALQRLAELMPARAREYYHRIAELSLKVYEDDQAVQYATLAVQANPDDAVAQARLGDIYLKMGNLESAASQYRAAVDLDPRAFEIWMKLATILSELGQFDEAEKTYRTIVSKAEDEGLIMDAGRRALNMAELDDRLPELETEFFPLVYRTPTKSAYRKLVLELYDRMTTRWVTQDRYGVQSERDQAANELASIGQRALPVLVDALQSNDVSQRATAVRLLGDVRQGNGAVALGRVVEDPQDPCVSLQHSGSRSLATTAPRRHCRAC